MFRSSLLAGIAGFTLLAGCSLDIGGTLFHEPDRQALVVGDEPAAVQTGAAILKAGGSAADAATAMYFAMVVTDPASAGLGGGGVCIVHDPAKGVSEEVNFLPKAAGQGSFAVPAAARGLAALQQTYGRLPWQKTVSPAEGYARTGFAMSRTLYARVTANLDKIRLDAALSHEFFDASGNVKPVGAPLTNPDLAKTLAAVRLEGPFVFKSGPLAKTLAAYTASQGSPLSEADLATDPVVRGTPQVIEVGGNYVFLPEASRGAGAFANRLLAKLKHDRHPKSQADIAAAIHAAAASLNLSETATGGTTGFAVTDGDGQSVTCAATMNAPFGSARTVRDTGVVLASAETAGHAYLAPLIASESADGQAVLAGAGTGGPDGSAALANVLLQLADDETIVQTKDLKIYGTSTEDHTNLIVCGDDSCSALPATTANGLGLKILLPAAKKH